MQTDLNVTKINAILAKYKAPDGSLASYDSVTETDKMLLKSVAAAAAEDLANLRGTLGIN
jgi:iron uptake system component EfeO